MASSLIEVTIVQASHLPHPTFSRHAFVEIVAGNDSRRTGNITMKKNASSWTPWDAKYVFPTLDDSSKIILSVFCDGIRQNKCLGKVEIDVRSLLEIQHQQRGEDVILSLADKKGNPSAGR